MSDANHVFIIRDVETLKALSDPLRLRIFALLQERTRTVKQLAQELRVAQTRLYYHMNQLESLGLIRVAETRVVAGIIEKHYRATATRISVDRSLFSPGAAPVDETIEALLAAILDGVRDAVRESVRAGLVDPRWESPAEGGLLLGRKWARLTRLEATELYDRMIAGVTEIEERAGRSPRPDTSTYEMLLGLYPVKDPDDDTNGDHGLHDR